MRGESPLLSIGAKDFFFSDCRSVFGVTFEFLHLRKMNGLVQRDRGVEEVVRCLD